MVVRGEQDHTLTLMQVRERRGKVYTGLWMNLSSYGRWDEPEAVARRVAAATVYQQGVAGGGLIQTSGMESYHAPEPRVSVSVGV